jgi:hypothetical protein
MIAIDGDHPLLTRVTLYRCPGPDRLRLLGMLDQYHREAVAGCAGFVGMAVHVAEQGEAVLVYAQWRDRGAFESCTGSAVAARAGEPLGGFLSESWTMDVALEARGAMHPPADG